MGALEAFLIVVGTLLAAYFGLKLNLGPFTVRQKLVLWTSFLVSLAITFGLGGLVSLVRISQAARPTVRGTIQNIDSRRQNHGTYNTHITLVTTGEPILLRIAYHGPHLRTGLPVEITYMASDSSLLELTSLDPDDHGWTVEETDGRVASQLSIAAGSLLAIIAGILLMFARRQADSLRVYR